MMDIHMHLSPGVDDGAEDMMMARMMLIRARDQRVGGIFCTPHNEAFDDSGDDVRMRFDSLKNKLGSAYPDMKLYLGCEVYCESGIMDQVLKKLKERQYPTMNGKQYVLMEFSPYVEPEGTVSCLEAMVNAGYKPIVAHMERYRYLRENMELVEKFRELGALIQINVYSLFDEDDDSIKNWARRLVQERKVDFMGTDAHKSYYRPPSSALGMSWLYENVERDYAEASAWGNAQKFLCGETNAEEGVKNG